MAMRNPDEELRQVIKAADKLPTQQRGQLIRHLEFRSWDETWNLFAQEINEKRATRGLPPATDEEINEEIYARRTPKELEALKREIQKGIDSLERGEGLPAEQVFAALEERYKNFRKAAS